MVGFFSSIHYVILKCIHINFIIMFRFKNILVPTDFSNGAAYALNYAADMAQSMDSILHIIHVIEPVVYPADMGFSQITYVDVENELKKSSDKKLGEITEELIQRKIKNHAEILFGTASNRITEYADDNDIDVICISTHGRSGIEHLLFGSTTEMVLRRSQCPVLALRFPKKEEKD